jgi:hypothetical protein
MKGFHREGMAEDKGNAFLLTQVGQPLPGEATFAPHDHGSAIRRDNP